MKRAEDLKELLKRIDHKSYPAYKDTAGKYQFPGYVLSIDHVQGDPFAAPSKVSILIRGREAGFPKELFDRKWKRIALQDMILRLFYRQVDHYSFQAKGSGKSGLMSVSRCGQEILERSDCQIEEGSGDLYFRMEIGFPANGRTIQARELEKIFFDFLPECVKKSLLYTSLDKKKWQQNMELSEDQQVIREELKKRDLVAFIANGSVLPRESGVSKRPMKDAVVFQSPKSMEVTLLLPFYGEIKGMGIAKGITLIVGGGYHGKSTLLEALELGVYNHIRGDGREYVITDETAFKIRAEDGRSVKDVDISMFINGLPNGKDTKSFYTEDASGSTSQAANVMEAIETGSRLFLIDEDTSATNFMIRDELMQRVVQRDAEPIIPFIDRITELSDKYGISTVLVAGSSGSYFHKADCIVQMNRYQPEEITEFAKMQAKQFPISEDTAPAYEMTAFRRIVRPDLEFKGRDRVKIKSMGRDGLSINRENVDLRYVEQIVDGGQVNALGYLILYAQRNLFDGKRSIRETVKELERIMEEKGLAGICEGSYLPANLTMPRTQEIFACFNRVRGLKL